MKSLVLAGALGAALVSVGASANQANDHRPNLVTKIGVTAEAGGGFGGFMSSIAASETTSQGVWNARMTFGSRLHFGGEAAYVGSAQRIKVPGSSTATNVAWIGQGFEGTARFNMLTGMWQPYAVAGVGWTHYMASNTVTGATSDFADNANVAQFPLGVGVAFRYSGFVADSRFAFHPATDLPTGLNMSTWDLAARVGFEF